MRTLPRRAAALTTLVTTLTLTLGACGSSDSDGGSDQDSSKESSKTTDAPSFDAKPATGDTVKGTNYSYVIPESWAVPKSPPAGFDPDSLAVDRKPTGSFANNINVLRQSPAPSGVTIDKLNDELGDELTKQGAKDVVTQKPVTIDGEPATHVSLSQSLNGAKNLTEQYYALRDGAMYVITFSYGTDVSQADRDEIAGSVLTTWSWA